MYKNINIFYENNLVLKRNENVNLYKITRPNICC